MVDLPMKRESLEVHQYLENNKVVYCPENHIMHLLKDPYGLEKKSGARCNNCKFRQKNEVYHCKKCSIDYCQKCYVWFTK